MPHVSERQRLLEDLDRVERRLMLSVNQFPHRTQRLREQLNNVHRLYATLSVHRYVQNRIQIRSSIVMQSGDDDQQYHANIDRHDAMRNYENGVGVGLSSGRGRSFREQLKRHVLNKY